MAMSQERKEYLYAYQKQKLKRVPLDMQISDYETLKAAADHVGQTVNGFIKQAIAERLERMRGK